jgi:hypothetical protein
MSGLSEVCALMARASVKMLSSSCGGNGGPHLSAWPSTQNVSNWECCCMSEIAFIATLETSASGFLLSKTLIFSSLQVVLMAELLSQTCWIRGGEKPYTFCIRVRIVKVAMLPQNSA